MDEERLSRWAAGITAGFFVVLWPAIVAFARVWKCAADCRTEHGRAIILGGVVGLILVPVSALALILARRLKARPLSFALVAVAAMTLLGAIGVWAGASGALIDGASVWASTGNSLVLAAVMAVYCAAVAGGSWMSAVGIRRLEAEE